MKKFMITGGLIGFVIGVGFGAVQQSGWPAVLWRASAAAFAAGLLMRWWGRLWLQSLRQARENQLAAETENAAQPATALKS